MKRKGCLIFRGFMWQSLRPGCLLCCSSWLVSLAGCRYNALDSAGGQHGSATTAFPSKESHLQIGSSWSLAAKTLNWKGQSSPGALCQVLFEAMLRVPPQRCWGYQHQLWALSTQLSLCALKDRCHAILFPVAPGTPGRLLGRRHLTRHAHGHSHFMVPACLSPSPTAEASGRDTTLVGDNTTNRAENVEASGQGPCTCRW